MLSSPSASPGVPSPDVLVVGGGAIGAAVAYEAARRGARVRLLERGEVASGCSYGTAGLICPSHADALASPGAIRDGLRWVLRRDSPFSVRPRPSLVPWLARFSAAALPRRSARATAALRTLAAVSLERHEQLARAGLPTGFARRGILSVYETERALDRARRAGAQVLDGAAARALEPTLAPEVAGAILHPGDAHCDPADLVTALADAARAAGAEVVTGVEVLRLRRDNGRITELDTTAGPVRAGAVVLAAGLWSRELARRAGVFVPLEGAKGYHVELGPDAARPGLPVYMEEARVIATPLAGRLRLAGTLELSGTDSGVDPVRLASLGRAADRTLRLPAGARPVRVWRGLRPCAPDGLPLIGAADGVSNLVLATGHAMLGTTLAPVTGEIVAGLLAGEPAKREHDVFLPSRFRRVWDTGGVLERARSGGAGWPW
jgi:D-amino-acid dehydrogenase